MACHVCLGLREPGHVPHVLTYMYISVATKIHSGSMVKADNAIGFRPSEWNYDTRPRAHPPV
jgi:hypothetical protein